MKYDVAIIGGGPAGLSAGIFTTRAGLKTICFEKLIVGGQASLSHEIANYPGFENISGYDLAEKMFNQASKFGAQFEFGDVVSLNQLKNGFSIKTKKSTFNANKVIIASGAKARKLNLENEQKFIGRGISYCASCDGNFFKGKDVAVVGGGDSAFEYAEYLSKLAKKVYLLNRSEKFRASNKRVDEVKKIKNVKILTSTKVVELHGDKQLESITILNNKKQKIKIDGLFVAIGHEPDLSYVNFKLKTDKNGYIIVDNNQATSVKNVYACGDIVSKTFKQVITACADGAKAGNSCIGGKA